jgi:hypothetical protein
MVCGDGTSDLEERGLDRAYSYIQRGWPVVAIAAIVEVAPNTVRARRPDSK